MKLLYQLLRGGSEPHIIKSTRVRGCLRLQGPAVTAEWGSQGCLRALGAQAPQCDEWGASAFFDVASTGVSKSPGLADVLGPSHAGGGVGGSRGIPAQASGEGKTPSSPSLPSYRLCLLPDAGWIPLGMSQGANMGSRISRPA